MPDHFIVPILQMSGLLKNTQQVNDRAGNWIWLSQVLNLRSFTQCQGLDRVSSGSKEETVKTWVRTWAGGTEGIPREEVLHTKGKWPSLANDYNSKWGPLSLPRISRAQP